MGRKGERRGKRIEGFGVFGGKREKDSEICPSVNSK